MFDCLYIVILNAAQRSEESRPRSFALLRMTDTGGGAGKTQIVRVTEHAKFGGSCRASIVYTLRHSLRFYPYLG